MGIWMIIYSGSVPLGALWTGRFAQGRGVSTVMLLSAGLCTLVAVAGVLGGLLGGPEPAEKTA